MRMPRRTATEKIPGETPKTTKNKGEAKSSMKIVSSKKEVQETKENYRASKKKQINTENIK